MQKFSFTDLLCHGVEVSGLTFVVFCLSAAAQQLTGSYPAAGAEIRGNLCSMLGLAELSGRTSDDSDKGWRLIVVGIAKVALENVPQLLLQSSFFAIVFDELTPLGRAKVLFSVLLGLASASQKMLEATRALVKWICQRKRQWDCLLRCSASIFCASFMLASLVVLWTVVKLYFVFHCKTHLWNVGSGCVEWK
eukprot:Skav208013  [mRNA]  locus=scaffold320:122749:123327:- [translate_table: standard]